MTPEEMAELRDKLAALLAKSQAVADTSTDGCEPHELMVEFADYDIVLSIALA